MVNPRHVKPQYERLLALEPQAVLPDLPRLRKVLQGGRVLLLYGAHLAEQLVPARELEILRPIGSLEQSDRLQ